MTFTSLIFTIGLGWMAFSDRFVSWQPWVAISFLLAIGVFLFCMCQLMGPKLHDIIKDHHASQPSRDTSESDE